MITDTGSITPDGLPEFIDKTTDTKVVEKVSQRRVEELFGNVMTKCRKNFNRLENMDATITQLFYYMERYFFNI